MDGNRRYAERRHVDKATGHTHGYGKMVEVIHWCIELGVKHITVYAFSIDNFRRAPDEVAALMQLAESKYVELARDNGLAEREGIQMHIVGDLSLPPPPVQGAAARLMRGTAALKGKRATLNVCFSYTSSEESVNAAAELQAAVRSGSLLARDVVPAALHGALRTGPDSPPVDLLVRTSGETRLSDFLLWQAAHAHLCYLPTLWPNLSYLEFARCVLSYQRHTATLAALQERAAARLERLAEREPHDEGGAEQSAAGECAHGAAAPCEGGKATAGRGLGALGAGGCRGASGREDGAGCSDRGNSCVSGCPGGRRQPSWLAKLRGWASSGAYRWTQLGPAPWPFSWLLRQFGVGTLCSRGGAGSGVWSTLGVGGAGRQLRLLRFFQRLEQERQAWIAAKAPL